MIAGKESIFNFDEATTQCHKKQTKGALVDWLWDNLKTKIITERKILKTTEKNRNPWAHIKNTDTVRFLKDGEVLDYNREPNTHWWRVELENH